MFVLFGGLLRKNGGEELRIWSYPGKDLPCREGQSTSLF